jgi:hypothetical protein
VNRFLASLPTVLPVVALALGWCALASAQVRGSSLPAAASLTGAEQMLGLQAGADVLITASQIKTFTGGGTPGLLPSNNLSDVASAPSARANLGLGAFATQSYATPPAIGGTTPAAGNFTTLGATGLVSTAASAAGGAGLNLPQGAPPTSPNNGDVWTTAAGFYAQINGVTVGPFGAGPGAIANNSVLANVSGGSAAASGVAVPSCSGTGNYLQWTAGTGFACVKPVAAMAVKPAAPASTVSTTLVMAGVGGTATITPSATGRVLITASGDCYTATAVVGIIVGLYHGTGGAPANGAAVTGTADGAAVHGRSSGTTALVALPFSITWVVTGLTVGTPIWIDLAFDTQNVADAANLADLTMTAVEF